MMKVGFKLFLSLVLCYFSNSYGSEYKSNIPLSCFKGSFLCPFSPELEYGLEKEFWHYTMTDQVDGMKLWIKKSSRYLQSFNYPYYRLKKRARLFLLREAAYVMMLNQLDLVQLADATTDLLKKGLIDYQDLQAMSHTSYFFGAINNMYLVNSPIVGIPEHQNAATMWATLAFVQFLLPQIFGYEAPINTLYSPRVMPDRFSCIDQISCKQMGAGTEGIVAAAFTMGLTDDPNLVRRALTILGDDSAGQHLVLCTSFACRFNNPTNQNDPKTSLAPFKEIGILMFIAEMYGKLGELDNMDKVLVYTRRRAVSLNWPFISLLSELEAKLHSHSPDSLLKRWDFTHGKKIGRIMLPLPYSIQKGGCKSCHASGKVPDPSIYEDDPM